jgi:hypothetical protein
MWFYARDQRTILFIDMMPLTMENWQLFNTKIIFNMPQFVVVVIKFEFVGSNLEILCTYILYINSVSLCVRAFVCLSRSWNPDPICPSVEVLKPRSRSCPSICLSGGFCSSIRGFLSVCPFVHPNKYPLQTVWNPAVLWSFFTHPNWGLSLILLIFKYPELMVLKFSNPQIRRVCNTPPTPLFPTLVNTRDF